MVERLTTRRTRTRPIGTVLELENELKNILKPLLAAHRERPRQNLVNPDGQVRPQPGQRDRPSQVWMRERLDLALRIGSRKHAVDRHPEGKQIRALIAIIARDQLGSHIARRTGRCDSGCVLPMG